MATDSTSPKDATVPVAEIRQLKKSFKHSTSAAIENVTLDIFPGRVTGLVGPDGAGKTTLLWPAARKWWKSGDLKIR